MYSVLQYGEMIADRARMEAYEAALRRAIRPGARVLDVGAGTGIFAFLACRLGAGQVTAVEPAPAIEAARALAAANGLEGRIRFVRAPLEELRLGERADVIVSDLRGALPWCGRHLPTLRLARERFLAPGGTLLPRRDRVFAAPVQARERYDAHLTRWCENPWGLDMAPARELAVNTLWSGAGAPDRLLAEPELVAELDYAGDLRPDLRSRVRFAVAEPGRVHGLLLWFDAEVADGIGFSNAPGAPERGYGRVLLPLREPLCVRPGDALEVALRAALQGDRYVWSWATRHRDASGALRASLRQSTFLGTLASSEELRARELGRRPAPGRSARIDRFVLCLLDGRRSVAEIARAAAERFPDELGDPREAEAHVTKLLAHYAAPEPGHPRAPHAAPGEARAPQAPLGQGSAAPAPRRASRRPARGSGPFAAA